MCGPEHLPGLGSSDIDRSPLSWGSGRIGRPASAACLNDHRGNKKNTRRYGEPVILTLNGRLKRPVRRRRAMCGITHESDAATPMAPLLVRRSSIVSDNANDRDVSTSSSHVVVSHSPGIARRITTGPQHGLNEAGCLTFCTVKDWERRR